MSEWSKKAVSTLIHAYREEEILYNYKLKLYHNKETRAIALENIQKKIATVNPNITIEQIKHKIQILRTQFTNELRKIRKSKENEIDSTFRYIPSIWIYNDLLFLKDFISRKVRKSNRDDEFETEEYFTEEVPTKSEPDETVEYIDCPKGIINLDSDIYSHSSNDIPDVNYEEDHEIIIPPSSNPPSAKRQKIEKLQIEKNTEISFTDESFQSTDNVSCFCNFIKSELNLMNTSDFFKCQEQIINIIFNVKRKNLNDLNDYYD